MQPCTVTKMASTTTTPAVGSTSTRPTSRSASKESKSMNTPSDLTIVIPAKNEAKLIPTLLNSLAKQDYPKMPNTRVLVADANSSDGTPGVVMSFSDRLKVEVLRGGMPSVGRNSGARLAETRYLLFLDADIELASDSLIRRAVEAARQSDLECLTTNIVCRD